MTPLQRIFISSVLMLTTHSAFSNTSIRGPVCGNGNYFLSPVEQVQSLLDTLAIEATPQGKKPVLPKREQCGLPKEDWSVCTGCEKGKNVAAFNKVVPILADENHRNWHYEWHHIRQEFNADGINSMGPSPEAIKKWQERGSIPADAAKFAREHNATGTLAGEDFFYMHRQMIKMMQIEMANVGEACIAPWEDLPASATDKQWPVPRAMNTKNPDFIKAENALLEEHREAGNELLKPENLRSMTLSQLGNKVQAELHGKLHTLYADPKNSCKGPADNSLACNDLEGDRTSHVNIHFWKLHGYIDKFVGAWLDANKYDVVATDCKTITDGRRCYQWKGTWLGKLPSPTAPPTTPSSAPPTSKRQNTSSPTKVSNL